MISDAVLTTVITVAGSLLVVYITYRLKNIRPKKERIDGILDAYERYIKHQDTENEQLRKENERLRERQGERI